MGLEVKLLGGLNASIGQQASLATRETFEGAPRRAYFRAVVAKIPKTYQPIFMELLDWVVFRDELYSLLPNSFGTVVLGTVVGGSVTSSATIEATVPGDTLVILSENTGSLDVLSVTNPTDKTVSISVAGEPSIGKIQIASDLVESTVQNDTVILTDSESGSSDHLQITKAAAKTVDWLLYRAS